MSYPGRRGAAHSRKHSRRNNCYNPNNPDWNAVHRPGLGRLFAPMTYTSISGERIARK